MLGMDKITEEIAHFIGIFNTNLEAARHRETYEDFSFSVTQVDLAWSSSESETSEVSFELLGYEPILNYRPIIPVFPMARFWELPHRTPVAESAVERPELTSLIALPGMRQAAPKLAATEVPHIEPIGSVANYFQQNILLDDSDAFSVGSHGISMFFSPTRANMLLNAADAVLSVSPVSDVEAPGSPEEMKLLVRAVAQALDVAAQDGDLGTAQGASLAGSYVNGQAATDLPLLEDYHVFEEEERKDELDKAAEGQSLATSGPLPEASVAVATGDNLVVNDAVIKSVWTAAKVTAVVGDHFEVNAIIQVNAIWDEDDLGASIAGWNSGDANTLFNLASFDRESGVDIVNSTATSNIFPEFWAVTEISGDLLIVNWLEQYAFLSEHDVGIVSASGGHAEVISGSNTAVNQVSLYELGLGYDLIVIGGSVYDASIIEQFNVLFDSDSVQGAPGFQTAGAASLSPSGNLLWNQATIFNIGAADRFDGLSQDYIDAADSLANDRPQLSSDILDDPAFAGLAGLRVLYISGDMINLQFVRQTNIVGDADQIALAMDAVTPRSGASFTVGTGGNALINNAAILDLDSLGKTYVGGDQYSQETLIQAEFLSLKPELGWHDPGQLASEAVLFLDDSMLKPDQGPAPGLLKVIDYDQSQDDGLQTLLAH